VFKDFLFFIFWMLPNLAKYTYGWLPLNFLKIPWVAIDGTLTRGHFKKKKKKKKNIFVIWKVWQKFQKIAKLVKFTLKKIINFPKFSFPFLLSKTQQNLSQLKSLNTILHFPLFKY
jgi:hypothetical protein